MESRPETPVGQKLREATHTGPMPAVPATPETGHQPADPRTSLAVVGALLLFFVLITLVAL